MKEIELNEIELIEKRVNSWVYDNIGRDFHFREYQLETIIYIIKSVILDMHETTIIEAPTGSGKSLICIIAAGVLARYYNKTSYILCSDLFLWQQYKEQIDNYKLDRFGYLKGSIGNYKCNVNKMDLSSSKCKLAKVFSLIMSDETYRNKYYKCYDKCVYMQQRKRAKEADVTLLTYQLWLHYMNLVNKNNSDMGFSSQFRKRDVIFCDECHNIPDIIQQFCSPTISEAGDKQRLMEIFEYAKNNDITYTVHSAHEKYDNFKYFWYLYYTKTEEKLSFPSTEYFKDIFYLDGIKDEITLLFDNMNIFQDNYEQIIDILHRYIDVVTLAHSMAMYITDNFKSDLFNTNDIDDDVLRISKLANWIETYRESLLSFLEAVDKAGQNYLLLETVKDEETHAVTYSFKCAKEDYLCNEYLMKHAQFKIMTSATVGGHASFDENIGIKFTESKTSYFVKLPSTFNFEQSPIYYIPTFKMNYANKAESFPKISAMAGKIIAANNCRGIVQTGSYENARLFYNSMPKDIKKRLLLYGDSRQKGVVMDEFKSSTNKILVGPTLTEGIDLPDDLCRFIILMKVPYPNITGKLVKKKLELFPLWYNSTTSNAIIQGIGRGIRNKKDWCRTYILDGCFSTLYYQTKDQYPKNIQERIKFINP